MRIPHCILVAAMLGAPAVSVAEQVRSDPYGHDAIEAGEFSEAEAALRAQLALEPDKPELLINLAAIYARTNRINEAQAMYARVMATDDVSLLLRPGHALGSHAIAERGLAKLERQRMAVR
ncbi:tetratricopeptide repeat protein [Sphingomonas baiyangensis]|uniref:Tetratricopeptide repeat protein n=1 Tax=Sphingomonas baiyangensis TaxID=2572576 RepID=A0A4U1L2R4_9SPHN|nr:tetratricopeptide repeat protein [Sphingomonas baiyangensis]TKD50510.1 tetratricopeptide repeat protein [Sphingomonas baiyangensis]